MALTVIRRPQLAEIDFTQSYQAIGTRRNDGSIQFYLPSHEFTSTRKLIYIYEGGSPYLGFQYAFQIDSNYFQIADNLSGEHTFYANTFIKYYKTKNRNINISSSELPIIYRIENSKWPTNSEDTARTVSSFTNDDGLVNLNLSGSLGTIQESDWVKIEGAATESINGVYRIIDAISASDVTINLRYASTYSFTGATVQKYYNNYAVLVKVYAGLELTHPLEPVKPIELINTLKIRPDENNISEISINNLVKNKLTLKNDPNFPSNVFSYYNAATNDLNLFTNFYIEYSETYEKNGSQFTDTYTQDNSNFIGGALLSKPPFKNRYLTTLGEHYNKFLTHFEFYRLFENHPFEISFLNTLKQSDEFPTYPGWYKKFQTLNVRQKYYQNGQYLDALDTEIEDLGQGIYRVQIPDDTLNNIDEIQVSIGVPEQTIENSTFTYDGVNSLDKWWAPTGPVNPDGNSLAFWVQVSPSGARATLSSSGNTSSFLLATPFITVIGYSYSFTINFTVSISSGTPEANLKLWLISKNTFDYLGQEAVNYSYNESLDLGNYGSGTHEVTEIFNCEYDSQYLAIGALVVDSGNLSVKINSITYNNPQYIPLIQDKGVIVEACCTKSLYYTTNTLDDLPNLNDWYNLDFGSNDWSTGNTPTGEFGAGVICTEDLKADYETNYSGFIRIYYDFTINITSGSVPYGDIIIRLKQGESSIPDGTESISIDNGNLSGYVDFNTSEGFDNITIKACGNGGDGTVTINSLRITNSVSEGNVTVKNCPENTIQLTWLNNLGAFEQYVFYTEKEYQVDIEDSITTEKNIAVGLPNSYGEFADTVQMQTSRSSRNKIVLRSPNLDTSEVEALKYIKTSPLVQIVNSLYDRRTVIVDADSFKVYDEGDKIKRLQFVISYTDQIPSQAL